MFDLMFDVSLEMQLPSRHKYILLLGGSLDTNLEQSLSFSKICLSCLNTKCFHYYHDKYVTPFIGYPANLFAMTANNQRVQDKRDLSIVSIAI